MATLTKCECFESTSVTAYAYECLSTLDILESSHRPSNEAHGLVIGSWFKEGPMAYRVTRSMSQIGTAFAGTIFTVDEVIVHRNWPQFILKFSQHLQCWLLRNVAQFSASNSHAVSAFRDRGCKTGKPRAHLVPGGSIYLCNKTLRAGHLEEIVLYNKDYKLRTSVFCVNRKPKHFMFAIAQNIAKTLKKTSSHVTLKF